MLIIKSSDIMIQVMCLNVDVIVISDNANSAISHQILSAGLPFGVSSPVVSVVFVLMMYYSLEKQLACLKYNDVSSG